MLQLGEEPLDQIALAIEAFAEAGLPLSIGFYRDIGHRALLFDQRADAVSIIRLVREYDHMWPEMIEQFVCDLTIMYLPSGKAELDGEALGIDDRVDFGRNAAS